MKKIKISCLPVAGKENPYQFLMIKGLNCNLNINAFNGVDNKFFGPLLTAIKFKPDYIHFDWETSYYYRKSLFLTLVSIPIFLFQIILIKYVFRIKLVWTPHNVFPHDVKWIKLHKIVRKIFASFMLWVRVFHEDSRVRLKNELSLNNNKIIIVPEGDYKEYYLNSTNEEESKARLELAQNSKIILFIGYIKPYKGIESLIASFYENFKNNDYKLLLAGKVMNQTYFEVLANLINDDRVIIHNKFINENDLQYYFNASYIVVLPFKKIENSGSVILAMGFKKLIVAPLVGVIPYRLKNQLDFLYSDSLDEVFVKIKNLDQELVKEIGRKNYLSLDEYKWTDFSKYFI